MVGMDRVHFLKLAFQKPLKKERKKEQLGRLMLPFGGARPVFLGVLLLAVSFMDG